MKLPEMYDFNLNDTYSLQVNNLKHFMVYDKEANQIIFNQSVIGDGEEGNYKIQLIITDNKQYKNVYDIEVEVKGYDQPEIEEQALQNQAKTISNCTAKITSITQFGRMIIRFKIDSEYLDYEKDS